MFFKNYKKQCLGENFKTNSNENYILYNYEPVVRR